MNRLLYWALALCLTLSSCTKSPLPEDMGGTPDREEENEENVVTRWIDKVMCEQYLYNEEYKQVERDLNLNYSQFLEKTLSEMGNNPLDYKAVPSWSTVGGYTLFSAIERVSQGGWSTKSFLDMSDTGYGFIAMLTASDHSLEEKNVAIAPLAVFPNSPAGRAGICRSMLITSVNGEAVTMNNAADLTNQLLYPRNGQQVELEFYELTKIETLQTATITACEVEQNPILKSCMVSEKVGYIHYLTFNRNYEAQLFFAIRDLSRAGAEDLILDMRYNTGGYVSTAGSLVRSISSKSDPRDIFCYYRFNDEYRKKLSGKYVLDVTHDMYFDYLPTESAAEQDLITDYSLNLPHKRLYCLTTFNTASACEIVINVMRGYGFDVKLIGSDPSTRGKNVGMIEQTLDHDGSRYHLLPVTFELYNSRREGGYSDGFPVDIETSQYSNFRDFGPKEELIYRALEMIKGESSATTRSDNEPSITPLSTPYLGEPQLIENR